MSIFNNHDSAAIKKEFLNIVFIGESYLGGMAGSKRVQNIINSLLKIGDISIHNLIIGNPNDKSDIEQKGEKNSVSYQKIYYKILNPFSIILYYYKGFKFIIKTKSHIAKNIVYCYDSPGILIFPFLVYSRIIKMRVVVDIVEDYNSLDKKNLRMKERSKLFFINILGKNIHLYTDGILAISSYLANKYYNITKGRIPLMQIPINVNFELFKEVKPNKRNNIYKIFYGGSFGEKDGLMYLLNAFEILMEYHKNIELILTGKPAKHGMDYILNRINNSNVKSKIHYLGYLEDRKYYKILQNCDIFCMTRINSKYANAGFPFKLGEMLATGKPVLATKVGDVNNFLENMVSAILVEPNSAEGIAKGLKFIIENPHQAMTIGLNGKGKALEYFDSDKISIKLRAFLNQLN